MRGQPNAVVPPAPVPPTTYDVNLGATVGATPYKLADERSVDLLVTSQYIYPSDHVVLQSTPSADGFTCALHFREGSYGALRRPLGASAASFALTSPTARARPSSRPPASAAAAARARTARPRVRRRRRGRGGGRARRPTTRRRFTRLWGTDTLQIALSVEGAATLSRPPAAAASKGGAAAGAGRRRSPDGLTAQGVPPAAERPDGGDVFSARSSSTPTARRSPTRPRRARRAAGRGRRGRRSPRRPHPRPARGLRVAAARARGVWDGEPPSEGDAEGNGGAARVGGAARRRPLPAAPPPATSTASPSRPRRAARSACRSSGPSRSTRRRRRRRRRRRCRARCCPRATSSCSTRTAPSRCSSATAASWSASPWAAPARRRPSRARG